MAIRPRILVEGACYHLIVRGNQGRRIFHDDSDFREYLGRLKRYRRRYEFELYGFCLMPNHVHLVGRVALSKNLSKFMHGVTLSYTIYFNERYSKAGHLWQGRFKNKVIVQDRYLVDCINYIELNPVRAKLVSAPHEYCWSSYRERALDTPLTGFKLLDSLPL